MADVNYQSMIDTTTNLNSVKEAGLIFHDTTLNISGRYSSDGTTKIFNPALDSTYSFMHAVGDMDLIDESYVGLGGAKGRIIFNDEGTDNITIADAELICGYSVTVSTGNIAVSNGNVTAKGTGGFDTTSDEAYLYLGDANTFLRNIKGATAPADILQVLSDGLIKLYATDSIDFSPAGTLALTLDTSQDATFAGSIILADNEFVGLGAAKGRIAFEDETTDIVRVIDAQLHIGATNASSRLVIGDVGKYIDNDYVNNIFTIASGGKIQIAPYDGLGFWSATPITKPAVTGSTGEIAALSSLLTALVNYGLITYSA